MDNDIHISSAAVSDRGLSEKRPQNEDSFLEMRSSGIFAVADGVGGAQAGEVASQMAMEIVGEAFANLTLGADAEEVMRTAIERANTAIHQMAQELPQLASMATTIVALHLADNIATIGHVGDSRLYRVNRNGELFRETDDHSMVADEVRAGRMTEEQAENHPSRNIISRALGAEATVDVEIKTIMVDPGTSFLICSDGITRHVGDAEIKGVLTFGGDPVDICEYLKGLCYERGAQDNLTAVVVKIATGAGDTVETTIDTATAEDEPTIATARPLSDNKTPFEDNDAELLELDTSEFTVPAALADEPSKTPIEDPTVDPTFEIEEVPATETPRISQEIQETPNEAAFTMFGRHGEPSPEIEKTGLLGRIASAVGLILLGAAIGLGVYQFVLLPKPVETGIPQLSEMRAANIPLSAFEENRRDVDKDPAGYVAKFAASPQDCEDFYLLGRAYMLSGDYVKARAALIEARNRLADADPVNAKILASDIAMALAVTSDTTIQSLLKKELEPTPKPANANVNTNSTR